MINHIVRKARKLLNASFSAAEVRNDYYFNRIYFRRITKLFKVHNSTEDLFKQTTAAISPLGLKFGSSLNSVAKDFGTPKYIYNNKNSSHNHKVYFYRRSFTDISLLVQLQFYNNKLFFIGLDVIKRKMEEFEKIEIINTVIQKYLEEPHLKGKAYPIIQDSDKNLVIINDDINFSICYLAGGMDLVYQEQIVKSMEHEFKDKPEKANLFYAF